MSEDTEDFAAMFEASLKAARFKQGQTIEGTIVGIGPEVAFVDVGGKGEATIDVEELKDADGRIEVSVGDRVQAVVVSTAGGLSLSRRLARGAATARRLEEAYESGLPVEGRVEGVVKGGFEVRVGGQRAFCPFSQMDILRSEPASHVGQTYTFRIIEFAEGGRNVVLSRRALLEAEQRAAAADVRRTIVPGAVLTGRVASVREFGAFIDLGGGIQGLLHVSEMSWARVADPSQVLKPGEPITVKVLEVDEGKGRISLGLKQLTEDPWSRAGAIYQAGQVHTGRVTRVTDFGAFVELEPGIEALAHLSTFPPTGQPRGWVSQVAPGTTGLFEILTVDPEKKRIGIAPVPEGSARASDAGATGGQIVPGARLKGKVERHESFGLFVFLGPGRTGLVPASETGLARETDAARTFPVGSDVDVVVLEVEPPPGRRIRLSVKAIQEAQEASEVREYQQRAEGGAPGGLGSLADKLRGALGTKRD